MNFNSENCSLVWLRRDLRLDDNMAISKAISLNTPFSICFVFDREILDKISENSYSTRDSNNNILDRRLFFIHKSLEEIDSKLKKLGSSLIVFHGYSTISIPKLIKKYRFKNLICSSDYEPLAIKRDNTIKSIIEKDGVNFFSVKDQCIFEKKEIMSNSKKPYTVFTPYKKKWLENFDSSMISNDYSPAQIKEKIIKNDFNFEYQLPPLSKVGFSEKCYFPKRIKIGCEGASDHLREFLTKIDAYKIDRDIPNLSGTSYLSIHLRFGNISIREILRQILYKIKKISDLSLGAQCWLSELIWREFYMQILFNFPYVTEGCFKREYDFLIWEKSKSLLNSWIEGQTGFPIIDAGMRQLNKTGYMHNRLRMLCASFLTKDYGIDWKEGENYFAIKLNDYDLSANNGGWQWAASTGCDAQPYFRIFNPVTQSKRFDPNGDFIKKFIPELSGLDSKTIHEPWLAPTDVLENAGIILGKNYPNPLIDHSSARLKSLERFKKIKFQSSQNQPFGLHTPDNSKL